MVTLQIDPFPAQEELETLWMAAWGESPVRDFSKILQRSLAHVCANDGSELVGFVNVAWDGGIHAFLLDTCVHPRLQRQGIAGCMVETARGLARDRGAQWLHVDFEPRLTRFYSACGFAPTSAGIIRLS
ncbi:GNAT family N-acetyltransferase [Rhizobium sp. DKSPLA3]|uniref:GNAT family N-acetyltransferase n=1 Tax=Rhizobium quercicola TaxID=2901226 RepID=A0A9X1NRX2_9HYPH|nr:GNAT family N-acetyltransferase [Rhizobium quercicola]MCD7109205.1 GNAT family N-acetyltransferase [Rhizobium quercicola]